MREDIGRKDKDRGKKFEEEKVKKLKKDLEKSGYEVAMSPPLPKAEQPKTAADDFAEMDRMAKSAAEGSPKEEKIPLEVKSVETFKQMDKAAQPKKDHRKYNYKGEPQIACSKCGAKVRTQAQLKLHLTRRDHASS